MLYNIKVFVAVQFVRQTYIYHEAHQFRTLLPAHQTIPQILFQPQNTQHTQIMYTRETLFGFMFPKKSDAMILQLL